MATASFVDIGLALNVTGFVLVLTGSAQYLHWSYIFTGLASDALKLIGFALEFSGFAPILHRLCIGFA